LNNLKKIKKLLIYQEHFKQIRISEMTKLLSIFSLSLFLILSSFDVSANHCSGGHKEVKDETKESSDNSEKE
tara:strand:+ start:379 stop:594 length:216 start_codon:yes stop_codon:yes gene_type:complete